MNYANGRIAIFDLGSFNQGYRRRKEKFYLRGGHGVFTWASWSLRWLFSRPGGYNYRARDHRRIAKQPACPVLRKSLSVLPKADLLFLPNKHYMVLKQLLRFYLNREIRLDKVHFAIRFNSSPYVTQYIANNTEKPKQFKHDDLKITFYKLINDAPYGKTIENIARRTVIRLLNDIKKARKLAD